MGDFPGNDLKNVSYISLTFWDPPHPPLNLAVRHTQFCYVFALATCSLLERADEGTAVIINKEEQETRPEQTAKKQEHTCSQ